MPDNISKLYNELKETYELGSEDDFRKYLSDSKNREALRKELESEYDVGDEAAFSSYLGFGQPQQAAQPQQGSGVTAVSQAAPVQQPTQQQPLYSQEDLQDVHQWNQPTPKGYARDNAGRLVTTRAGEGGSVYATPVTQTPEEQAIQQRMSQVGEIYLEPESYSFEPDTGDGKMHYSWRNGRRIGQLDPGALRFAHIGRNYSSEAYTQAEQEAADMTDEQLIKAFNDLYSAYGKDSDNALTQGYGREDASRMMAYATEMRYRDIGMPGHARDYGNDGKPKSSGVYHYYAAKMNPAVSSEMDAQDKMSWDDRVAYLSEALKDKQARENVITIGRGTDEDRKALEEDKRKLLAGSMLYARDNGRFPEEAYNVVVGAASNATPTDTGFWNGFKSTFTQMWRDVKYFSGEAANLIADDRGDVIDAIKALDKYGVDAETKLAAGTLSNMGLLGMLLFDGDEKDAAEGAGRILHGCIVRDKDGRIDIDTTRAALIKKLKNTYSWGDRTMRDNVFNTAMATQTEGDAAWWGQNVAQLVPSAAAVVVGVTTRNPALAEAVGQIGMGYMCISSGSNAMQEARLYGATDGQVWTAGIVNAALEYATERVPFDRYTKRVFGEVKATSARKLMDAVVDVNNPAHHEIQQLLTAARKELGNGKLAKAYAGDILAEGTSEFAAGTLQKAAEILYKNPEDYPTFMEILEEGIESFKGGAAMGGIMGSISTGATYFEADNRRKKAGTVTVGIYDSGDGMGVPIEIVGQDSNGNYVAIDGQHKEVIVKPEEVQGVTTFSYDEWKKGEAQHNQDQSFSDGYNASDDEQAGVKDRLDTALAVLSQKGYDDRWIDFLDNRPVDEIIDHLEKSGLSDDIDAVMEYINARTAYEGMLQHVQDDMEGAIAESEAAVDAQTHIETGAVHHAVLKTGGEVWVVGGNVALTPEGNIDIENSDGDLIVLDPATGGKRMIHISDLASADEPVMADQLKQEAAATIQETMAQAAADRIDGVIQAGGEYNMLSDDNTNYHVTVLEKRDDGTVLLQVDGEEVPYVMAQEMAQQWVDNARAAAIASKVEQEPVIDDAPEQDVPVDETDMPEETEPVEEVPTAENKMIPDEVDEADSEPMPVDDNGDVDWLSTTPERGYEHLYNENGLSQEEADNIVKNSIADAEATLKKVSGKKPKPGTAAQLPKYNADKEAYETNVAAAQAAVDYWNGVKAVRDQLQAELVRAQAEERARLDAEAREKAAEELKQQQAELAAKRVEAEERGPFKAGIAVIDKWDNAPKVDGVRDQVMLADGTAIPGHYVLVEAGSATPSHDPSTGWKASEGFPVDENGGTVNDRDYERDQAAQDITIRMSETYDSRAAQSVPVVTSDGVVLSGNGRTIAGDLAAQAGTDGAYIDYLKEYGGKYGFNAEQIGAMQHPRVLFVPDEKMPYTAETFAKFNAQEMKGQNLTETAVKLGKTVDDVTFNDVIGLINQFDTMSQFYGDDTAPTQAITMLLRGGVINPMQHAQMFDGDKVSTQGEEMLENLLLGKAFEGNPDAIRQLMSMPSVRQQVVSALAEIANNAALGDYSLDNELSQAIALVEAARRGNIKQGDTVSNYARQMSLFPDETGTTVADYRNAMVLILGDILNGRGKNTLKNLLALYNQHAANAAAGVGDLFTGGVKSPENILKEAVEFIKNSNKNELKNELKQAVEQRKESAGQPAGSARNQETGEQAGSAVEGSDGVGGTDESVAQAEAEVDTEPTDGQKEAGNYKKGHVKIDGFDVTIEQPKGSVRSGVDASGKAWSQEMHNTYGYIRGTEGVDGDHIDVFLSDHLDSWNGMVYVVDQVNKDGSFDEHKVMYGFDSEQEARDAYLSNYEEGWTGLGNITSVTRDEFKKWVDSSHRKTKPFAEYKSVKVSRPIQDLEGYTEDEILADVRAFIEQQLEDAGIEGVTIKGMALHGSRMRGDARPDSDLDVVVEYEGDISEDSFFNLVNYDLNYRGPNGVIIDINPITRGKSGTLEQYMERSRRYDEEKRAANIETGGAVVDQLKGMGVDVNTDINEYRKTLSDAKKDNSEAGTIKYMRTSDGTVYGFVYRGKINLDPRKIDAELPLHEYGHLWGEALRIIAPDKWRQVVEVLKGDTDTWNFLKERKPELTTDDAIADEMIAEFSGKNGEQRLKEELERLSQTNADYKTKWGNIYKNIVKAIQDFWKQVGDFLHIDYKSPQQVYDQVLKDFASGMNPRAKVEKYLKERDAEFVDAVNRGDMEGATRLFNDALTAEVGNGMTPFVSVGGYGGKLRDLARKVKRGDKAAIDEVAKLMAPIIPKDAVLIPAPSHTGRATYMLDVANAIAKITGCDVADVLRGTKRAMQYEQKKQTGKAITSAEMGVTVDGELPAGKVPVVLDNVVATGNTAEACVQALGKGIVCSLTKATDQYDHVASLKSANVVVRDSKGDVIPLSKRFDLSQSKRLGNIQFSKSEGGAEAVSNREAALRDGLVEVLRGAGIEVVTDVEEGQRVLDAVNGRVQAMGFANSREEFDNTRDRAVAETGIVMTGLAEEEVTVVDVPRHDFTGVAPIKQAEAWGKKNLVTPKDKKGNYIDKPKLKDGTEYSISSNAVGKFLSKSATKNSDNLGVHLSVLKKLKDVIHESMEAEVHPDYKKDETGKRDPKNGYNPDYLVHRLYGAVDIDGKTYRVKTTIIENGNESRNYPHSYEVTEIELLDDSMAGSESRSVNIGREGHDTKNRLSNNSIAGAKLLQGVEKSYDPGKKLLDESEKSTESGVNLHRVWHGSGAEFDTFDHSHMGDGEGAQAYGWGTYVTEVEDIGRRYAETAGGVRYKGHDVDELYEHSIDGMEDSERNAAWMLSRAMRTFGFSDAVERLRSLYKQDLEKSNRLKGLSIEQTMERYGCSRADAKRYIKDAAAKADMWQQRLDALEGMREEDFTAPSRVLYEVEIPEEAGAVYLDHVALMKDQPDVLESVDNALTAQGWRRQEIDDTPVFTKGEKKIILSDGLSGGELYLVLEGGLGSDRAASEFLHEAGVTGIVYPSNYLGGGNRMGSKNYVIFNEADAQITGREKFFRTADGTAYGFVKDGRIYIDPRIATSETPVHEYTHLWCAALRRVNPAAWARLKEALLGQKDVLEHVKKLYPELEGDELMDEVFAHYSGRRGADRLHREEEAEMAKADGVLNKARIKVIFDKIRRALTRFWELSRDLFAGKVEGIEKLSAEDFADMAMADLLRGFNGGKTAVHGTARQERTLMGVHNITQEKLRSALKLGGLANPSMAVIDTSVSGFDSFGDISLIPDADLIASKTGRNAGTWGADAYSPRFPETHRRLGKGGDKKMREWIKSLGMRKEMVFNTEEQFNDYYNSFNIRDNALVYPFLHEKGLSDQVDYYTHKNVDSRLEDDLREANGDAFVLLKRFDDDDEYKKKITDIVVGDEVGKISRKDGENFQEFRDRRRAWAKQIREALTEEDGFISRHLADDLLYSQARAYRENGKFNEGRTLVNAEEYIRDNGLQEEYQQYFEQKMQELGAETQIYAGSDSQGRSKFKPADLDQISRQMKKQGRAGAEGGIFEDSPGAIRAKLLNPMKTLDQIRKEKNRIVDHEQFEQAREQYQEELREYADRYTRGSAGALADIITSGNMVATAQRYNISLDADAVADLNEFKSRIRQLPTEYFETKFERPVMLEEFRKVVVPDDLPLDLYGALDRAGLEIVEYKSGDKDDRRRKMLAATKDAPGIRFHFVGEKGASQADKSDSGNRMDNRAIAEQMEQAGKDARNIKLATGWERGADGKWRYEIMDFDDVDVIGNLEWLERHPDAKRVRELIHKINANLFGMGEPLTKAEQAEYAAIVEKWHGALRFDKPFKNPDRLTLQDYVKADELFAAYPELREMPVKFEELDGETRGVYRPHRKEIAISVKLRYSKDGLRNELLHEVQHAIQHIEGFASGSSEQLVRSAWDNIHGINKTINRLADSLGYQDWIKTLTPEKINAADDLRRKGRWFNLMYVFAKDNFKDPDVRDKFIKKLDEANDVIAENKQVTGDGLTAYQAYRASAGEVEARNVQSRSNMSREERRVSLAENTEDIPRDKQTVWTGFNGESVMYDIRRGPAPQKTGVGYKVFVLKDGKLYPPMVANPGGEATPFGLWLNADAAPVAGTSKTGRPKVKAGGKGTQGGSGQLAYRPGWHLGEIPYALQFNRDNKETGASRELFPANFVWAEVEYADDVDYQDEAMSYGMNASGKFQHSLAGLPRVPENGSYRYRTNPNPETDPWIITGAMKVKRILKPSEVDEMVRTAGREPQKRQSGAITDEQVEALNQQLRENIAQYNDTPEGSVAGETGNIYHTKDGKQVVYRSLFEDLMPENSLFGNQQQETRPARPMTDAERIQAMSDEELLRQVSEGDVDTGERNFYSDEYDRRHNQEYFKECDRYRQMLEDSDTTEGQAEEMLLDIIRDWRDKFNTPERTTLLAQFDTINDYYSEKVEERMRREEEEEIDRENAKFFEETDDSELTDEERLEKQRLIELGYLSDDSKNRNQSKPEPAPAPVEAKTASPGEIVEKPKSVFGRPKGRKAQFDPTEMSLRKLDEGEMSNVERRYVESQQFDFTGTDKIESAADVAYIFRQLETSAVENCFLVLIKDGKPTILHIGMGGYAMTVANIGSGVLAASALNPDTVIMLHNHPSGTLKPSAQDISLHKKVVRMFGEEKVDPSIIIDITSGKYAMFTDSELVSEQRPTSAENEVSHQVYSFSKMVFSKDWNPETAFQVKSSEDVAAFVSSHRLGDHDKVSLIVVDHAKHIVGNIFLPWTSLNDKPMREVADQVAKYTHQMGGSGCILYGSGMDLDTKNLKKINSQLSAGDIQLVDCISVENGRNKSYNDYGMMREPDEDYSHVNEAHDPSGDDLDSYTEGRTIDDSVLTSMMRAAADNKASAAMRTEAMRKLGGNLSKLRQAMSLQREYDRGTVNRVVQLAKDMMDSGLFKDFSRTELKRLVGLINNAAGREDITWQLEKVFDMLQDHEIKEWENLLHKLINIRGSKINAQGVQVQGQLDKTGQLMLQAMKDGMQLDASHISQRIADCIGRMGDDDPVIAKNAGYEYEGLLLANRYIETIQELKLEAADNAAELRREQERIYEFYKAPVLDKDGNPVINKLSGEQRMTERKRLKPEFRRPMTDENKAIREHVETSIKALQNAERAMKADIVEAYKELTDALGVGLGASVTRAKEWREAQVERAKEITHNINSDIKDRPALEQPRDIPAGILEPTVNNTLLKAVQLPAQTLEKMLRYLSANAYNGEGYLFNRFMRGYMYASAQEFDRRYEALQILDDKVKEIFNGQHIRRAGIIPVKVHLWRQLYDLEKDYKRFPPIKVTYWSRGEFVDDELSQGEALYFYMVNKMEDGKMKLRRMGVSEEDVETIRQQLDPRFIEIADWLQEEFLPSRRVLYSEVYERMYGAPMPVVENYVHLMISEGSIERDDDINNYAFDATNPSTVTGSVIKRTRNTKPIDIHTDVFDLIARDIDDMEHWAAFAEFNRDLNTMRNYGRLRNALKNVHSLEFGGGKEALRAFDDACAVVAGSYRPALYHAKWDKVAYEVMRQAVQACIALKNFTAFKQTLSIPSFWSEASAEELAKHTNPYSLLASVVGKAEWEWAMENLPGFRKRWLSRQMGDPRILKSELGLSRTRSKIASWFSRYGMYLNARIDAAAVATGARAVYETRKKLYLNDGYTPEQAEQKAMTDAWVAYNNSQQSTEGPFVSPVQLDKTSGSMLFTMFRTASMGYSRKNQTAFRNLKYRIRSLLKGGDYDKQSIDFMRKLYEREGLDENQAQTRAERVYNRGKYKAVWDMVIYSFILTALWNMGKKFLQVVDCDDDDERDKAWRDILAQSVFGPIEGWVAGDVMSDVGTLLLTGQKVTSRNITKDHPFASELGGIVDKFGVDKYEAATMCVNFASVMLTGVDPQVVSDLFVGVTDAFNGDFEAEKEFWIAVYRLNQFPQSQIDEVYIDELGIWGKDIKSTDMETLARRYADYMRHRNAPYLDWARDEESKKKADDRYYKRIDEKVKERLDGRGIEWLEAAYVKGDEHLQKLIKSAIEKRVKDVEDGELSRLYDETTIPATKSAVKSELVKRIGYDDPYDSPSQEYGKIYNRIKTTTDLEEDIALARAQKNAEQAGDEDRAKEISKARTRLTKEYRNKLTGGDGDQMIMDELREARKELLSELGIM